MDLEMDFKISDESVQMLKELISTVPKSYIVQDSKGNQFIGNAKYKIKDIHRVRKGKRYIIKFNYTNECLFKGVRV